MHKCFPMAGSKEPKYLILGSRTTRITEERGFYYTSDVFFYRFLDELYGGYTFEQTFNEILKTINVNGERSYKLNLWSKLNDELAEKDIALWDFSEAYEADGANDGDTTDIVPNLKLSDFVNLHKGMKLIVNGSRSANKRFSPARIYFREFKNKFPEPTFVVSASGAANGYAARRKAEWEAALSIK